MKYIVFLLVGLSWFVGGFAHATSFGRIGAANIASIDNKPAICLPNDAEEAFSVGWISLSESYVRNAGSWGVALKTGVKPLALKPGGCIVFGVVPDGYELDDYKIKTQPLKLEVNRTYVFSLSDAYRPRDSYTAVFCISKTAEGTLKYLQYTRLAGGGEVVPSCDAKRNGNVPEQTVPAN